MPEPTTRRFDAVLFDMDGVLVDSEPRWNDVRVAFAARHGRAWNADDQFACMGGNSRQWSTTMAERLALADMPVMAIQDEIVAQVVALIHRGSVDIMPGAQAAVRAIAARWPVVIASSAHPEVIAASVDALGLHDVFTGAITSADEVEHGKPAPDVYLLAAERLGVRADRCLVVEDSTNGVLAGRAAGAYVVLIPNPSVPPTAEAFDAADAVVANLAALDPDALPS
jgi:HAD superfamily hydrolase (TIGR01509 family)